MTMLSRRAFLVTTAAKTSHFRGFPKRCGFAQHKIEHCVKMAETLKQHARWLDLAADVYASLAEGDEDAAVARYGDFLEGIPDEPLAETALVRLMTGAAADLRASDDCSDA
jgi:hypothetical protein